MDRKLQDGTLVVVGDIDGFDVCTQILVCGEPALAQAGYGGVALALHLEGMVDPLDRWAVEGEEVGEGVGEAGGPG